jgi:hypothetical protein
MAITLARVADAVPFGSPRHTGAGPIRLQRDPGRHGAATVLPPHYPPGGAAAEYPARRVQAPIDSS